ncbi:hypothetical protein LJR003_001505 [Devosia sp. LjRoot3]
MDAIGVVQHVFIGEPQHGKPSLSKIAVARLVVSFNASDAVRVTVNFDNQASMKARKVDIVGAELHLLAEVPAACPEWKNKAPEPNFGDSRLGSQFSSQRLAQRPPPRPSPQGGGCRIPAPSL